MSTANRIVVIVENGTVSQVFAADPDAACEVIDFDVVAREQGDDGLKQFAADATAGLTEVW